MFAKECKFELSEDQYNKIEFWDKAHKCSLQPKYGMRKYCGAIGGAISMTFTPTSLGMVIEAKCACGNSIDVSRDF